MISSENDNKLKPQKEDALKEKTIPAKKVEITVPEEELNEDEINADGEVIDSGNNYTAAENDHDTNATL